MSATEQRLMTSKDLAQMMGWSVNTVHQRRYRGDSLPRAITLGTVIRYRREDVEAWLEEHSENGKGPGAGPGPSTDATPKKGADVGD